MNRFIAGRKNFALWRDICSMDRESSESNGQRGQEFLTKEELRIRLNLPSTRMIDEMMKRRMIPFLRWGAKTIRFDYAKVKASLERFEHKAVGQK